MSPLSRRLQLNTTPRIRLELATMPCHKNRVNDASYILLCTILYVHFSMEKLRNYPMSFFSKTKKNIYTHDRIKRVSTRFFIRYHRKFDVKDITTAIRMTFFYYAPQHIICIGEIMGHQLNSFFFSSCYTTE
jgi:hypothetical protein